jgi:hydroxyacylglutathione hydrolase
MFRVEPIACLRDNYAYWLTCTESGAAAIVDPSEAAPILASAEATGRVPTILLCTHHHLDHVGGVPELAARYPGIRVVASTYDRDRIDGQTEAVNDGDHLALGNVSIEAMLVPGHTLGAVAFVARSTMATAVFTGDTMFLAGCGRLFEGSPADMHRSLRRIVNLPDDTLVYCGHEYTAENLRFAASLEPSNGAVARAASRTDQLRAQGLPTVPHSIAVERAINPFVRTHSAELRQSLNLGAGASDVEVLAAAREAKNNWRP